MPDSIPTPSQPKISHKLAIRTLILVLILGSLYLGYQVWQDKSKDLSFGPANTQGWIGAVEFKDDGQQAVAFDPTGKKMASPAWKAGRTDREITWDPSGNRLFFVSDREENNFHVFRWNPTDGSEPQRRTIGSRAFGYPEFSREPSDEKEDVSLVVCGGYVLEYHPKEQTTTQMLPIQGREITQSDDEQSGGAGGQFSGFYSQLGITSFKMAKWCKGKTWIAAVMHRQQGEILVMQKMTPGADGKIPKPIPVVAGDHIDFDVNPKDGTLVYSCQNFQWPDDTHVPAEYTKNNKITRPYSHVVMHVDPDAPNPEPLALSKDDVIAFGAPSISPDGASIAITAGPYENGVGIAPKVLVSAPIAAGGLLNSRSQLATGDIYEPSWSPDGQLLVFARRGKDGKRTIFTIHKDGSSEVNVSGAAGNFGTPFFSPQTK
jgi:hypothetical protein